MLLFQNDAVLKRFALLFNPRLNTIRNSRNPFRLNAVRIFLNGMKFGKVFAALSAAGLAISSERLTLSGFSGSPLFCAADVPNHEDITLNAIAAFVFKLIANLQPYLLEYI